MQSHEQHGGRCRHKAPGFRHVKHSIKPALIIFTDTSAPRFRWIGGVSWATGMFKRVGQFFGNIKLTTMIAALVISAIIVSVAVVTAATYINLSASTRATALEQQTTNLKTAATVLQAKSSGATVEWSEAGGINKISVWAMPQQFLNNDLVDSIGRVTGEAATLFVWDEASQDFIRMTTTPIVGTDGARIVDTPLGQASAAYGPIRQDLLRPRPKLRPPLLHRERGVGRCGGSAVGEAYAEARDAGVPVPPVIVKLPDDVAIPEARGCCAEGGAGGRWLARECLGPMGCCWVRQRFRWCWSW